MTILPLLLLCLLSAAVALVTLRRAGAAGWILAAFGLLAATGAALLMAPGESVMGGTPLLIDGYVRLVAGLGCLMAFVLTLLAATLDPDRHAPARGRMPITAVPLASAITVGAGTLALAVTPSQSALPAALVGVAALIALAAVPVGESNAAAGRALLRVVALAGALIIGAAAVIFGHSMPLADNPTAVGVMALTLAGAVGLRVGAIPFHAPIARLVPRAGLIAPYVLIWASIPLIVTAIGAVASGITPTELPLGAERGMITIFALLTLLVAPVVAAVTDDLDHVVSYAIVQDMGLLLLAFAAGPPAWEPIRTWVLVVAVTKTALVAWSVAMRDCFGSVRLGELHGWAIRAPLLAAALAVVAVATLGVPTFAAAAVRRDIADSVFREPLASAVFLAGLLAVLPYLRLAAVGLSAPGPLVRRAPDERLRRPAAWLLRSRAARRVAAAATPQPPRAAAERPGRGLAEAARSERDPAADRAAARVADIARRFAIGAGRSALPGDGRADVGRPARTPTNRTRRRPLRERAGQLGSVLLEAWHLNLVPIAAGLVLVLAVTSLAVSVGWFDLRGAAAEGRPVPIVSQLQDAADESPAP